MSVGTPLRLARERAKLSAEQIAERIKVSLEKIEALECDDLEALPHGIYLDGIVRAYAREVAIDPEPLLQRIHQEVRELDNRAKWNVSSDLAEFPEEGTAEPTLFAAPEDATIAPARPAREHRTPGFIAVGLGLLLAAVVWSGERYGRQATERVEVIANAPQPTREAATSTPLEPSPSDRLAPSEVSPPRSVGAVSESPAPLRPVENVSGLWTLLTHVESSSVSRFEDLMLGYRIELEQTGAHIKGAGKKISEGGVPISPRAQTPIVVGGTIDGDRLTLAFNERGARRPTQGKFVLLLDGNRTLRGRFSSSAARSSGTVEAYRLVQ